MKPNQAGASYFWVHVRADHHVGLVRSLFIFGWDICHQHCPGNPKPRFCASRGKSAALRSEKDAFG